MKICLFGGSFWLAILLLAGGCNNSASSDKLPPTEINGVKLDTPQLMAEFAKAPLELQTKVNDGVIQVRYKQYVQAMKQLDDVLSSPGVTEKQKKVLTQVIGQLKELAEKPSQ